MTGFSTSLELGKIEKSKLSLALKKVFRLVEEIRSHPVNKNVQQCNVQTGIQTSRSSYKASSSKNSSEIKFHCYLHIYLDAQLHQ